VADGKTINQKKLRAVLKAAIWGCFIAAILEIVLIHAVLDDWGYAVGHARMTDDFFLVGIIFSLPAVILERIFGFLPDPKGTEIYLTAFLTIIVYAIAFAIIATFWQFIIRRKSGISN